MPSLITLVPPLHEPLSLNEVTAYLKLEQGEDAAQVAAAITAAREACELYTGLALIDRTVRLRAQMMGQRFYLKGAPVQEITAVTCDLGDAQESLDVGAVALMEQGGRSYLDLPGAWMNHHVTAEYRIGLGPDWNAVPDLLRQGMLRFIAHHYEQRSTPALGTLPGAVSALWQPFRRVRV